MDPECEAWAELCSAAFREAFLNVLKDKGLPELQGYKKNTAAKNAYLQLDPDQLSRLSRYLGCGSNYENSELLLWPDHVAGKTVRQLDRETHAGYKSGDEVVTYPLARALHIADLYLKAGTHLQSSDVGEAFQDTTSAAMETVRRMNDIARRYLGRTLNQEKGELRSDRVRPEFKQQVLRDSLLVIPAAMKSANPDYIESLAKPKQLLALCDEVLGPLSLADTQHVK